MKTLLVPSAFVLTAALVASPLIAQTETVEPRLLILPDSEDAVLPGDQVGASHGVKVNRGSGFPEPVVEIVEPVEDVATPAPPQRRRVVRRSRW